MDIRKALDNASLGHVEYMDWVRNNTRLILDEIESLDRTVTRLEREVNKMKDKIEDLEWELENV